MTIAYDRAKLVQRPVAWDMPKVLTISTTLGILGVFSSFLWFWIAEEIFQLDRPTVQTLMFLKLTVAGHLTIFLSRTGEAPFWSSPSPSGSLLWTAIGTKIAGTLLAVYGFYMAPIGWDLAAWTWAYALAWFVFNDFVKVKVYHLIAHRALLERRHLKRIATPLQP